MQNIIHCIKCRPHFDLQHLFETFLMWCILYEIQGEISSNSVQCDIDTVMTSQQYV
jgi:hypothetical protein